MSILQGIGPVFAIILLGCWLSRIGFPSREFWPASDKVAYYVMFPALLIDSLGKADFSAVPVSAMAGAIYLTMAASLAVWYVVRRSLDLPGPAFTSVFQGVLRCNTFVALSAVLALYGQQGLAVAGVLLMCMIPVVNMLCVAVLNRYGAADGGRGPSAVARELVRNPLILGCAAGLALNLLHLDLPLGVGGTFSVLGRAALPVGLLAVGSALRFGNLFGQLRPLIVSSIMKLALMPLAAFAFCWLLGIPHLARSVMVLLCACPLAASAYILARQMGGDHELAASLITAQTLLSALTLPLVAWALL